MTDWMNGGVGYQIYPRSFADADGDGIGDLQGVTQRLDHLVWLGVDAIWLNPIYPSPNRDWGYDVADHTAVHPDLGTLDDLDELVRAASEHGIRVILDLVPNHTSEAHPWFVSAREGRESPHRDLYVWADPKPDGSPPNNWLAAFKDGSAWTLDESSGQYYLHNFLRSMPDLNWWNDDVRDEFERILRFWFDRGIHGFRIDVAHAIVKDRELRDDPLAQPDDHDEIRRLGRRQVYSMNRPEAIDVLRSWRRIADSYHPQRALIGETYVLDVERLLSYYGTGTDSLHLAFNFPFAFSDLASDTMRTVVDALESGLPAPALPVWMGSNHDIGRFPTRWCGGSEEKARAALVMLMGLRGTVFLLYGDEIGMTSADLTRDQLKDPAGINGWPEDKGRDPHRTPMQWTSEDGAGFTRPGVEPWLPFGDAAARNVHDQMADPTSMLHLCRKLIAMRKERPDLRDGSYRRVDHDRLWVWRRGSGTTVAINAHDAPAPAPAGRLLVSSRRGAEPRARVSQLAPWEAVILED